MAPIGVTPRRTDVLRKGGLLDKRAVVVRGSKLFLAGDKTTSCGLVLQTGVELSNRVEMSDGACAVTARWIGWFSSWSTSVDA
jgi:hypothetical protein